ncbi:hypothetical protein ELH75_15055 [Rhizobium leguminosarum]|uniref:hypothetical protein n=1 Tax=Rhizobium leguminosarum TaxID=384 RepID=UPI001031753B|nr:hypothetical protein [Rhizobium leguminosarum]TAZ62452.1 hypothetical protein ELH75_15055 [Rhizobium leguminosarum]
MTFSYSKVLSLMSPFLRGVVTFSKQIGFCHVCHLQPQREPSPAEGAIAMTDNDLPLLDEIIAALQRLRERVADAAEPEPAPDVTDDDFAPCKSDQLPLAAQRIGIARGREAAMTSYSLALAKMSRLQGQGW